MVSDFGVPQGLTGSWIVSILHKVQEDVRLAAQAAPTTASTIADASSVQAVNAQTTLSTGTSSTADQTHSHTEVVRPGELLGDPAIVEIPAAERNGKRDLSNNHRFIELP